MNNWKYRAEAEVNFCLLKMSDEEIVRSCPESKDIFYRFYLLLITSYCL
jgi:hypothetical protein